MGTKRGNRRRMQRDSDAQGDLFSADLYPVRVRTARVGALDLTLRIKSAMGEALKACPDSATIVAARMSELLPAERALTPDALYAYTAPSKPDHVMDIDRFVAFVRATGANWLYDLLVEDEGLIVMEGREAHLAQLGLARQEAARLKQTVRFMERELTRNPVTVTRPRRPGRR